jgi:hypothetical protein
VSRAGLVMVLVVAVGGVLAGCAAGPSSIAAKVSQPGDGAIVSDVQCVQHDGGVNVTGTVKRNTDQRQPYLQTYQELHVSIQNSAGRRIGSTHPLRTMTITTHGSAQSFRLTVAIRGTPAECQVDWGPTEYRLVTTR